MTVNYNQLGSSSPLAIGSAPEAPKDSSDIIKDRKDQLTAHGVGMVHALYAGFTPMHEAGIIKDTTNAGDKAIGQARVETAQRDGSDWAGGWREFVDSKSGSAKLIHLSMTYPDGTRPGSRRAATEVKIAEPKLIGPTKLPSNERTVRVSFDDDGTPHVSGKNRGHSYSVDHSNAHSRHADLDTADAVFREVATGLKVMAEGIELGISDLPAAQVASTSPAA